MKLQVTNTRTKIISDDLSIIDSINSGILTHQVPGARHSSSYKNGYWDGKKSFMTKDCEFPSGLLDIVKKYLNLRHQDLDYEVEDLREDLSVKDYEVYPYDLYDYQEAAVETALKHKNCIIKSPTGSGKTLMIAATLKALSGKKGVVFFHRKQICEQTWDFLKDCGLDPGIVTGTRKIVKDLVLCTVQSVARIIDTHLDESEFILVDECHEFAGGEQYTKVISSFPGARFRIGFTATPPKDIYRKLNVVGALGPVFPVVTTQDLTERGKLSKAIVNIVDVKNDPELLIRVKNNSSYQQCYDMAISKNDYRNDLIIKLVEDIKKENSKAKILILCSRTDHLDHLHKSISNSKVVQGKMNMNIRYREIKKFLEDTQGVLIGTQVMQTGVNINQLTHMINARAYKSEEPVVQALGRLLRTGQDSDTVQFYDFFDRGLKFFESQSKDRIKTYKREGHEIREIKVEV